MFFFVSQVTLQCLHYFRLVDYSYISKLLSCLDKSTTLRVKTKNDVRTFKRVEFFHSKKLSNYCVWNLELVSSEISKTRNGFLCMNYRFSKNTNKRHCLYRNRYTFIVALWRNLWDPISQISFRFLIICIENLAQKTRQSATINEYLFLYSTLLKVLTSFFV